MNVPPHPKGSYPMIKFPLTLYPPLAPLSPSPTLSPPLLSPPLTPSRPPIPKPLVWTPPLAPSRPLSPLKMGGVQMRGFGGVQKNPRPCLHTYISHIGSKRCPVETHMDSNPNDTQITRKFITQQHTKSAYQASNPWAVWKYGGFLRGTPNHPFIHWDFSLYTIQRERGTPLS